MSPKSVFIVRAFSQVIYTCVAFIKSEMIRKMCGMAEDKNFQKTFVDIFCY